MWASRAPDTYTKRSRPATVAPASVTLPGNPGNNNQLYDEYPSSHTIWYGYDSNTFGGRTYDVHQSVAASNQCTCYYHPSGGMRSIVMTAPGTTAGPYDNHTYAILYDHLGRPIYIAQHRDEQRALRAALLGPRRPP